MWMQSIGRAALSQYSSMPLSSGKSRPSDKVPKVP